MNKLRGGGTSKGRPSGRSKGRRSGTSKGRRSGTPKRHPVWLLVGGGAPRRRPVLLLVGGALGAGVVGFRMLRWKRDGAREMSEREQAFGSPVDAGSTAAAASEEQVTANERSDGVRRTGDDRLVQRVAGGESDPDAAADPTIASDSAPGQPTGVDSPRKDA
ncbi:hypothetical protein ACFPJ1_26215 [Kribbella qitaiheensis]|uniref:hypothetical protein n=1 Tax=Kribbella qitaiheensis TaxID=1544730 RepID=UPI003621F2EE